MNPEKKEKGSALYIVPQAAYAVTVMLCIRQGQYSAKDAVQAHTHKLWPAATQPLLTSLLF